MSPKVNIYAECSTPQLSTESSSEKISPVATFGATSEGESLPTPESSSVTSGPGSPSISQTCPTPTGGADFIDKYDIPRPPDYGIHDPARGSSSSSDLRNQSGGDFSPLQDPDAGIHDDGGKPLFTCLDAHAMLEVGKVAEYGSRKYSLDNWVKLPDGKRRYLDSAMRHLWSSLAGQRFDDESGIDHLAHATWNCLAALAFSLKEVRDGRS